MIERRHMGAHKKAAELEADVQAYMVAMGMT